MMPRYPSAEEHLTELEAICAAWRDAPYRLPYLWNDLIGRIRALGYGYGDAVRWLEAAVKRPGRVR